MNLTDSIEILERLEARADESQRRYAIELLAYRDVRDDRVSDPASLELPAAEWAIYRTAYAEAQLKRDLQR